MISTMMKQSKEIHSLQEGEQPVMGAAWLIDGHQYKCTGLLVSEWVQSE